MLYGVAFLHPPPHTHTPDCDSTKVGGGVVVENMPKDAASQNSLKAGKTEFAGEFCQQIPCRKIHMEPNPRELVSAIPE